VPMSDLTRVSSSTATDASRSRTSLTAVRAAVVLVQIGGKDRGWMPTSAALPPGWTIAGYDSVKSWVDEHQRPTTEAENEEMVRRDAGRTEPRSVERLSASARNR
jgi:hypothetical protein